VLDILDYLEQQTPPIVHRDIKPANIIIGAKDERAHLVDFGIARAYAPSYAQSKQTTALGTPGYAPPEQYQGNAEPRSDLYALAATLHHLLTNRDPTEYPPFQFPPARTLNPHLSLEIEAVLTRALQLDRSQRYQTALEMKRDLDEIGFRYFDMPDSFSTDSRGGYRLSPPSSIPRIPVSEPGSAYRSGHMQQQMFYEPSLSQPVSRSPLTPYQPIDVYERYRQQPPMMQPSSSNVRYVFLLFVLCMFLLGLLAFFVFGFIL